MESRGLGPCGTNHDAVGETKGLRARGSRGNCQGSDPAGTTRTRSGKPRSFGHGAVAGTARARTPQERPGYGRGNPGAPGTGQSRELRELGPRGNDQDRVGEAQGLGAWGSRRNCWGLDPAGTTMTRSGNPRGSGHGTVAGTAGARMDEDPVPPGRGSDRTRSRGTG